MQPVHTQQGSGRHLLLFSVVSLLGSNCWSRGSRPANQAAQLATACSARSQLEEIGAKALCQLAQQERRPDFQPALQHRHSSGQLPPASWTIGHIPAVHQGPAAVPYLDSLLSYLLDCVAPNATARCQAAAGAATLVAAPGSTAAAVQLVIAGTWWLCGFPLPRPT